VLSLQRLSAKMLKHFYAYPLTYSLILINSLVYLLTILWSGNIIDIDVQTSADMGALFAPYMVLDGQWWRLLTAMFLHGGMTHVLMNMFSLYLIGRGAEAYFSKSAYLSIYLFSGFLGSFASLLMHDESIGLGASGAIFGLFGALAGFFLAYKEQIQDHSKAFMKQFGIIIGINLIIGLAIPQVDVSAHIGGLVIGFIGGFMLSKKPQWLWVYSLVMLALMFLSSRILIHQYYSFLV